MSDGDELAQLKAKLGALRSNDAKHRAELEAQWERHWEQDAYYRDAEARQAAMDEWSQKYIEETMAHQSAAIRRELAADADHAAAQLRLPPVPEEKRQREIAEREEKVLRIRDAEAKRTGLAIKDRSPSKTRDE
eukprot:CAMPEP_0174832774 /NCGR_PEP_ID=MMETSP1114-20130205/3849_1 /TAXON_ID=312471 /ORGANISM="Neobodo designis, Strain CCAP 1951/1" /LENGTH=133 /DNA_ID=CAMNT_0016066641 /DNA_START=32 /DNA_END=433 /DNA_ORIENTATION=-